MIKKLVICQNYGHFQKKLRSVIVSQNHYLNKMFDVHPLTLTQQNICLAFVESNRAGQGGEVWLIYEAKRHRGRKPCFNTTDLFNIQIYFLKFEILTWKC